ncbi:hypothetical protein ACFL59_14220 [Planctomycetota bacterium]
MTGDTVPTGRHGHCMSFDVARNAMIVFGGSLYHDASVMFDDTTEY